EPGWPHWRRHYIPCASRRRLDGNTSTITEWDPAHSLAREKAAESRSTFYVRVASISCMASKAMVSLADREFLQWVSSAAFANPFSEQRYELDRKITGTSFRNETERGRFLQRSVSERIQKLAALGKADVRLYSGADRELMRNVLLFEVYHQFCERLD